VQPCPGERRRPVVGVDDPAITTYGRLVETVRRLETAFAATITGDSGLPLPTFEVLLRLGRSPGDQLTMSELAHQLGVTSGGATRLVDRVSDVGLVERRACTTDRRVHHVRLTPEGRERLEQALAGHRADLARELTARLSADERDRLDDLLDVLRADQPRTATRTTTPSTTRTATP
jgi:MarR family transcriptional regulator, 2-MHQ and catechol-resistance regulon repressor